MSDTKVMLAAGIVITSIGFAIFLVAAGVALAQWAGYGSEVRC